MQVYFAAVAAPSPHRQGLVVWTAAVLSDIGALASLLSTAERSRIRRFRQSADAQRFVTGRSLLRLAVAGRLGLSAPNVDIDSTCPECGRDHGAPRLTGAIQGFLRVSVSHSGVVVAVALSDSAAIGVDVEEVRSVPLEEMAPLILTDEESRELSTLPASCRARALLTCWTRKEAYLKALGRGLAVDMRAVSVHVLPSAPPRLRSTLGGSTPDRWAVHDVELGAHYVGAVVTEDRGLLARRALSAAALRAAAAEGFLSCEEERP